MKIKINGQFELDIDTLTDEQREQIIAAFAGVAEKPKVFRPQVGDKYEYLHDDGFSQATWYGSACDHDRLACGNVHPVGKGEYLHRRRIAVKAMWDYVESQMPFVPDWTFPQEKFCPVYSHTEATWRMSWGTQSQHQFEFPYVAGKDIERFLADNADNLAVIAEGIEKWGDVMGARSL